MLFAKKGNPANHKAYHILWSQEIIPTSRVSLASTLCTQGYLPMLQVQLEEWLLYGGFFWWAHTDPCILSLDVYFNFAV